MTEILVATWSFIIGLFSGIWNIVEEVLAWVWQVLYHLHLDAPRLEGLLIGVILTWFLLRRDKHPLFRLISAPLKLVVDILDLGWDQIVEVVSDIKNTLVGWYITAVNSVKNAIKYSIRVITENLRVVKEKLVKKKNEDE